VTDTHQKRWPLIDDALWQQGHCSSN